MLSRYRKPVSFLLGIVMIVSLLAACGDPAQPTTDASPAGSEQAGTPAEQSQAPSGEAVTLTYWVELSAGKVTEVISNLGDTPLYRELQERMGVNIEFMHPPTGQTKEQFNLIIASNELPDIMEINWLDTQYYPGGPEKAIQDQVIIPLNDYAGLMPNLMDYYAGHPDVHKQALTDSGYYAFFPFIRGHEELTITYGPIIRRDWLEELALDVPVTLRDWEDVLLAFKEEKGATAGLTFDQIYYAQYGPIVGSFGIAARYYVDDGEIKFGPVQAEYREAMELLNRWYSLGILDPDFATRQKNTDMDALVTSGQSGMFFNLQGGGIGNYLSLMYGQGDSYDLMGIPYPIKEEGATMEVGAKTWSLNSACAAITTANKYPEISMKLLDYGYSEEGQILFNYGIEGESFTVQDGGNIYMDNITNPENSTMANALSFYTRVHYNGPFIQHNEAHSQYMAYQQQREAVATWAGNATKTEEFMLPPLSPLEDEGALFANRFNEIQTYSDEKTFAYITGQESLDNFEANVQVMWDMGLQDVLDIYNNALERYNHRLDLIG